MKIDVCGCVMCSCSCSLSIVSSAMRKWRVCTNWFRPARDFHRMSKRHLVWQISCHLRVRLWSKVIRKKTNWIWNCRKSFDVVLCVEIVAKEFIKTSVGMATRNAGGKSIFTSARRFYEWNSRPLYNGMHFSRGKVFLNAIKMKTNKNKLFS